MYRSRILYSLVKFPLDFVIVFIAFFLAGEIRSRTDLIPNIRLPIQVIPSNELLVFAILGASIWVILFSMRGMYRVTPDNPLLEEIIESGKRSIWWFFVYIGVVYLSSGFLFSYEIPRLVIFFSLILSFFGIILIRIWVRWVYMLLASYWYIEKQRILVLTDSQDKWYDDTSFTKYMYKLETDVEPIEKMIREREIDALLYLWKDRQNPRTRRYIELCQIYGVRFAYPKIERSTEHIPHREWYIGDTPVMEASGVTIEPFERVIKRCIDIVFSFLSLIALSPLLVIIGFLIKVEDPSGPIIYKNRRVWFAGKEFYLYKFRYMFWKYSIKDSYWLDGKSDTALAFEEKLKAKNNTRKWPLYKIANDPRKTKVGAIIEKFSIDELPQLWNVFVGDMSLVWPRPHQPREVEQYEEHQYQVLTIKPGITGMAQVHGRENNDFSEEVALDTYYIENYSLGLDLLIVLKTFGVVLARAFRS